MIIYPTTDYFDQKFDHPMHGPCWLVMIKREFKLEYYVGDFGYERHQDITPKEIEHWFGLSKEEQTFMLLRGSINGE